MTLNPRTQHALEQYMALHTEVQSMLRSHHASLIEAGWHPAEAWAFCQTVESRILGPAMDVARAVIQLEDQVEERVRLAVDEELRERGLDDPRSGSGGS